MPRRVGRVHRHRSQKNRRARQLARRDGNLAFNEFTGHHPRDGRRRRWVRTRVERLFDGAGAGVRRAHWRGWQRVDAGRRVRCSERLQPTARPRRATDARRLGRQPKLASRFVGGSHRAERAADRRAADRDSQRRQRCIRFDRRWARRGVPRRVEHERPHERYERDVQRTSVCRRRPVRDGGVPRAGFVDPKRRTSCKQRCRLHARVGRLSQRGHRQPRHLRQPTRRKWRQPRRGRIHRLAVTERPGGARRGVWRWPVPRRVGRSSNRLPLQRLRDPPRHERCADRLERVRFGPIERGATSRSCRVRRHAVPRGLATRPTFSDSRRTDLGGGRSARRGWIRRVAGRHDRNRT